jgi:repressor LexA
MYGMKPLTQRQREIFDFIVGLKESGDGIPSIREISKHFGFKSITTVVDHVRAIKNKGFLETEPGKARSFKAITAISKFQRPVINIPIYGSIPAGLPQNEEQNAKGCISIDVGTLGIRKTARTFGLQVKGDSMIGKNIIDGDYVVLEHGLTPKNGDVVAALIDNESTLKTFVLQNKKPYLKAENPRYPNLTPAHELVIQGIMVGLVRKSR